MAISTSVELAKKNFAGHLATIAPDLDLNALLAVVAVEASGQGVDPKTRMPTIRFENHKFFEFWGYGKTELFNQHFKFNALERWKDHYFNLDAAEPNWVKLHTGNQALEWSAYTLATTIDLDSYNAAIYSTSWGLGQIMGFHYERLGYYTPQGMAADAATEYGQLEMLVNFIRTDPRLLAAVKTKSWPSFARYYNGSGQVAKYSNWLAEAYTHALTLK